MNIYPNAIAGNSLFVTRNTSSGTAAEADAAAAAERLRLWDAADDKSAYCTCAHRLEVHSLNDEPGHYGQCCSIQGCRCNFFSPHKVKRPKFRQWEGFW